MLSGNKNKCKKKKKKKKAYARFKRGKKTNKKNTHAMTIWSKHAKILKLQQLIFVRTV